MPRLFSHAHFATLDTILSLFWVGTVLALGRAVEARRPVRMCMQAGAVWGLALLTKIHAWLLAPLALAWTFWRLGIRRGLAAWSAWLAVGLALLFAGWPWLWFDPAARLRGFLGTSVDRLALRVMYFGTVYRDRDVPWHYPWVLFAVTVPVGLHLLGMVGVWHAYRGRREDPFPLLPLGGMGLLLAVFSTRVPVYDGERLFLPVFFLWAILIGRGFASWWDGSRRAWQRSVLGLLLASQALGLIALHPFGLSYYNALVGGLPGAERLGLELTYWGDAVDAVLLDELAWRAAPGQAAALVPTLHPIQPAASLTPALHARRVTLRADTPGSAADWLVVSRRTAYWLPGLTAALHRRRAAALRSRQGVWLSGLWTGPADPTTPP